MIPYNQRDAKITNTESFKLKSCMRKAADAIDKRFCFDIIPEDRWIVITLYTKHNIAIFLIQASRCVHSASTVRGGQALVDGGTGWDRAHVR